MNSDEPNYVDVSLDLANQLAEAVFKASQFKSLAAKYKNERDDFQNQLNELNSTADKD